MADSQDPVPANSVEREKPNEGTSPARSMPPSWRTRRLWIAKRKSAARSGNSRRSPCHLANIYEESAFEGGIPRKAEANGSKLYRHVANSWPRRGNVTRGRKQQAAENYARELARMPVRSDLLRFRFLNLPPPCCHFPQYSMSARQTPRGEHGTRI